MNKSLPKGLWCSIRVPLGTTEQDVIATIDRVCGVVLEEDCVSCGDRPGHDGRLICIISFKDAVMTKILTWMLSETPINGLTVEFTPPRRPTWDQQ
jgi:hypothetical protein